MILVLITVATSAVDVSPIGIQVVQVNAYLSVCVCASACMHVSINYIKMHLVKINKPATVEHSVHFTAVECFLRQEWWDKCTDLTL